MQKIITFRANEEDLNKLNDLITEFQKINKGIKITNSIIIRIAIIQLWEKNCLPYKGEEKPYKYRAEKDIPYT